MSESGRRIKRKQLMLLKNPLCCFCGGQTKSVSEDHIPPQACFPAGYHPEGMEFPACNSCNQSTREYDLIFGFYAMALDFNENNINTKDFNKRIAGVFNNYPDALPHANLSANEKRRKLRSMGWQRPPGQTLAETGIYEVSGKTKTSIFVALRKMACALYFKETGNILSVSHRITGCWQQMQDAQRAPIAHYFNDLLPEYRQVERKTIRNYGKRFCYKFGYNKDHDFFAFAAQIGDGIMLSGFTIPPHQKLPSPMVMPIWRVVDPRNSPGNNSDSVFS